MTTAKRALSVLIVVMGGVCAQAIAQPVPPPPAGGDVGLQQAVPAVPGPAGLAPAAAADPAALWRDVRVVLVTSRLGLTAEQVASIRAALDGLQAHAAESAAARAQLWQESGEALSQALAAWATGRRAPAAAQTAAENAISTADRLDDDFRRAVDGTYDAVLSLLAEQQQELVETYDEYEARRAAERMYAGAPSLAEFIVRQLTALRELMPDEYDMLRPLYAGRIARAIVPPDAPSYVATEDAVFQLMDQVMSWTDERFDQQLPSLPQQVRDFLTLSDETAARPVAYDEFDNWLTDARTAKYLAVYGTPTAAVAPETPAPADDLKAAVRRARIITALNQMRIAPQQAAQLQPIAVEASTTAAATEANKASIASINSGQLAQALPYMAAGNALNEKWQAFFEQIRRLMAEQNQALLKALVPRVAAVRRVLAPEQAAMVDWRVPPEATGSQSIEEERLLQREMLADIRDALQLIELLKPLDNMTFRRVRLVRIEEWLVHYVPADDPDFQQIRDDVALEITRTRGIPRDEWERGAGTAAAAFILRLAGRSYQDTWEPSDAPMDWYTVADLLKDPQTAEVLDQMAGAGR